MADELDVGGIRKVELSMELFKIREIRRESTCLAGRYNELHFS